jgi:DNA-binding transcriptional ArsR family regulator
MVSGSSIKEVDVFRALGDPIRLEIIQRLSQFTNNTISSVVGGLDISRQGARKHIQVLADANVISLTPDGRQTHLTLNQEALDQSRKFIANLENEWDVRLEALKTLVEDE